MRNLDQKGRGTALRVFIEKPHGNGSLGEIQMIGPFYQQSYQQVSQFLDLDEATYGLSRMPRASSWAGVPLEFAPSNQSTRSEAQPSPLLFRDLKMQCLRLSWKLGA